MNPLKSAASIAFDRAIAREIIREHTKAIATPQPVEPTGHAGDGGLQKHSVGGLYPFTVYGQETPEGTRYGVMNAATGEETGARWGCLTAYAIANELKVGHDTIARVIIRDAYIEEKVAAFQALYAQAKASA